MENFTVDSEIYIKSVLEDVRKRNSTEPEFLQTMEEVLPALKPVLDKHPEYLVLFDEIVQKHMAGLPQDDSVRWLDISIAQIVQIFKEHGISISPYIARKVLKTEASRNVPFARQRP